jgi:hypothetical protein
MFSDGLRFARFLMVIGSLSPLFILWAIRGARVIPDKWWVLACISLAVIPNLVLLARWKIAIANNDHRVVQARSARDQSEHLLVYLFAMLIPLFGVDLGDVRGIASVLAAVLFVAFVFWHMNLHYINLLFALAGYQVFTVQVATSLGNDPGKSRPIIVLSRRNEIEPNTQIDGFRLSDNVLIEKG